MTLENLKEKNKVYTLFVDSASGIMKIIGMLYDTDELYKTINYPVRILYPRLLMKDNSSLKFSELFSFSSEKESFIMSNKIISFAQSSPSLAAAFLNVIEKQNQFMTTNNIPHFDISNDVPIDMLQ